MHANVRGHRFDPVVPRYLEQTYWWAYGHPLAVRVFERQWLINLILWGNFRRLRDAAIAALGGRLEGRTLQISCVYGDLTRRIAARLARGAQLHVIDVLHIQLENLARKLPRRLLERRGPNGRDPPAVQLFQADSSAFEFRTGTIETEYRKSCAGIMKTFPLDHVVLCFSIDSMLRTEDGLQGKLF